MSALEPVDHRVRACPSMPITGAAYMQNHSQGLAPLTGKLASVRDCIEPQLICKSEQVKYCKALHFRFD